MGKLVAHWIPFGAPIYSLDSLKRVGEELLDELADEAVMTPGAWVTIQGEMAGIKLLLERLGVTDV